MAALWRASILLWGLCVLCVPIFLRQFVNIRVIRPQTFEIGSGTRLFRFPLQNPFVAR